MRSYSWLKWGIRDVPKYFLRNYYDRDISNIDNYSCVFSSQKYFISYSFPISNISKNWMKIYIDHTKEYYNPHFTEFDLKKYMIRLDLNHQMKIKHRMKLTIAHGQADNISYDSSLPSTTFDRSYIFDNIRGEFLFNYNVL